MIGTIVFIVGLIVFSLFLLLTIVMISIYVARSRGEDLESEDVIDKYAEYSASIVFIIIGVIIVIYIL